MPLPLTQARVVDPNDPGKELEIGQSGEIAVRGPQVMKGYWRNPEATRRAFHDGWFLTGDIGRIDEDGYVYVADRKKEMIKSRAFSVAPAELEAALLEHPDIADCGVVGAPDTEAGEVPAAFIVPRKGCTLDEAALNDYFSKRLAGYKMIRRWHLTDAIPRTPSGKILRRVLRDKLL